MKKLFRLYLPLLLLLSVLLVSCGEKTRITGREFVKKPVLIDMLVDLHLVDALTNDRYFYRKYDTDSIDLVSPILDKYGVSQHKFDTTMYTYGQHPDLLDEIYSDVLHKLNEMLEENEIKEEESKAEKARSLQPQ